MRKAGFVSESSLQARDEPYEVLSDGQPTGLVELGIDWTLTETPYLGPGGALPDPEQFFRLFRKEFDGAYAERSLFVLTWPPHVTGHRAPMQELERLIAYIKAKPGVWFATTEQIARYVKRQAGMP